MSDNGAHDELQVLADGGPVTIKIEIGAGLIGDWALRLMSGDTLAEAWTGTSADRRADVVTIAPERLLAEGARVEWVITIFGPGKDAGYDVGLRASQKRHNNFDFPPRRQGEVKARTVAIERGLLVPKRATPRGE